MTAYRGTTEKQESKGGRVRWPPYTQWERSVLENKLLGNCESLDFLETFWNPVYDQRDLIQYQRATAVWKMRLSGKTFKDISRELGIDQRKACALFSGKNLHPYLLQMYLNSQTLYKPKPGWKWILECTPKPTNMFPKCIMVPEKIQSYQDVLDFLRQFPPVSLNHPAIKFFGLSSEWIDQHKAELFGFLLGFMVGDAGKYYPEYEYRSRHSTKSTVWTNMAVKESNLRILRFVQLCLATIGIDSHQQLTRTEVIRWVSTSTNILTWILRVCLGLDVNQRTSKNPVVMGWIFRCPREFIIAFIQGVSESDGSMDNHGYYAAIASVPNSTFFQKILAAIGTPSRVHPKRCPTQLRVNLEPAIQLPFFHPIIRSYRFLSMVNHAQRRKIFLPPPLFLAAPRTISADQIRAAFASILGIDSCSVTRERAPESTEFL